MILIHCDKKMHWGGGFIHVKNLANNAQLHGHETCDFIVAQILTMLFAHFCSNFCRRNLLHATIEGKFSLKIIKTLNLKNCNIFAFSNKKTTA